MTEENQDAVVGRVVRKYAQEHKSLSALRFRSYEIGERLVALGKALQDSPEGVTIDGRGLKDVPSEVSNNDFKSSELDLPGIDAMCSEIRGCFSTLVRLGQQKKELGID